MARLIPLGEAVTRGEKKMLEYLQRHLPEDWVVFGNAMVSSGELTRELDAIVVGDRAVWVVDDKGFGGVITGDEHTWTLSDGTARERVLDGVLHAAKMVKGRLSSIDSRLAGVWVQGLVLLSAEDAEYHIADARVGDCVRRLAGCECYFRRAPIPRSRPLSPAERESVQSCLAGPNVLDRHRKRFSQIGPYGLLETVALGPVVRTYRAEHGRTHDLVELKAYDLSDLPDQRSREEARRRAEREFEALRRLRDTQGVVRVAESYQSVEGFGSDLFFFALDLPQGPCLAARQEDASWPLVARLSAAKRLCEIVSAVHEAGVLHRNLSPACIHFSRTEADFQLTGFEFSRLGQSTLHVSGDEFPVGPYTAPEVRDSIHNASKASDVYSLGVILFELFSGRRPFGNRPRAAEDPNPTLQVLGGVLATEKLANLEALLHLMLDYHAEGRPQDLKEVPEFLRELMAESPEPLSPPHHPLPIGARLGEFTVLSYLGSGGCFHAYRVASSSNDSQEWVAKVVRYPELLETARREFAALNSLDHPNIVRAFDVRERPDAPYHLLERFIQGRMAAEVAAEGPVAPQAVTGWALQLAGALSYMESRSPRIWHGDISPRNLILQEDRPILIDFGLAHLDDGHFGGGVTGTAPYRPPERDVAGTPWPSSGDLYSLGLVLAELLFGELPYHCDGGQWRKEKVREELFQLPDRGSRELLQALRTAIDPDPTRRFGSAEEFRQALMITPELGGRPAPPPVVRGSNAYLSQVLQLYNRGGCNAENRGMDSPFARATYVPTELDMDLLPEILGRRYALVVLAGNPGDGKTAFLQQIALRLGFQGESLPLNHWVLQDEAGWTFECVLDGSAADSERGLGSDGVLDELLNPLEEAGERPDLARSLGRTQLLAINDGRLLEYLEDRAENGSWVVLHLLRYLGEEPGEPHPDVVLVDLNHRSLATGEPGDAFNLVLSSLLEGGWGDHRPAVSPWLECGNCRVAEGCHVRFNVDTLLHPTLGPLVRERLGALLMLAHSRGRAHTTMRELRSTLAFAFFGDQSCEQINAELEWGGDDVEGRDPPADPRRRRRAGLYFNRLFATGARGGRLLEDLAGFDPARVNNPRFDRTAAAALRNPAHLEELFLPADGRRLHVALDFTREREEDSGLEVYDTLRRRAFFEGRSEAWGSVDGDRFWLQMIPYRGGRAWLENLARFRRGERQLPADLCRRLCRAVSCTDNVPEELLGAYLAVRTASSPKTELVVVRLFPLSDFRLEWEKAEGKATPLGELPTALLLRYGERGDPTLEISADLFELLVRFDQGYRLGSQELEGVAAHLQLFKNRLLAMPAEEVCLLHPTLGKYRAKQRLMEGIRQIALEELA